MAGPTAAPGLIVIVIGAARSGTKIVRDVLAVHPNVAKINYDINYLWRIGNERMPHDELSPDDLTDSTKSRIVAKIDNHRHGAPILVEKTVSNCLRVPFVDAVFPQARFLHLIRDGRDVLESSYRQWQAAPDWRYILQKARTFPLLTNPRYGLRYLAQTLLPGTSGGTRTWGPRYMGIDADLESLSLIEVCAIQWARCVDRAVADLERVARERVLEVRYEELVRDPVGHLHRVAQFLEVDIDGYEGRSAANAISPANVGKGAKALPTAEMTAAIPHMEETLAALGYM